MCRPVTSQPSALDRAELPVLLPLLVRQCIGLRAQRILIDPVDRSTCAGRSRTFTRAVLAVPGVAGSDQICPPVLGAGPIDARLALSNFVTGAAFTGRRVSEVGRNRLRGQRPSTPFRRVTSLANGPEVGQAMGPTLRNWLYVVLFGRVSDPAHPAVRAPNREPRLSLGRREVDNDPARRRLVLVAAALVGALVFLVVSPAAFPCSRWRVRCGSSVLA